MAKYTKQEQADAIERLRGFVKPGDTVYHILVSVSRTGMSRTIKPVVFQLGTDGQLQRWYLGFLTCKALGLASDNDQGVKVNGCGMDIGFHLVNNLSMALFPDGFGCIGQRCPSNSHHNGEQDHTPHTDAHPHWHGGGAIGYALQSEWL